MMHFFLGDPIVQAEPMLLDPNLVAEFWIAQQSKRFSAREEKLNSWLPDLMMTAFWGDGDADYAWLIVEAIHEQDPQQHHIEVFSAGPVEDILSHHGAEVIDRVEAKAKQDESFAKVLGGVWPSNLPDELWQRLQCVRDTSIWGDART